VQGLVNRHILFPPGVALAFPAGTRIAGDALSCGNRKSIARDAGSRYNVAVRALVERLVARGKPAKLALGAAMRKLLHIAWGVIHSGKKFCAQTALA